MSIASLREQAPSRAPAPVDPATEIPLVDWGSLALRAGRVGPVLPHMAWLLRFSETITEQTLTDEAWRLAATPYGLGRRIAPPRLPGGRHRWRQEPVPPAVAFAPREITGPDALAAWLDRELGVPLDPEHGAGWRMAAARTAGGGTAVLLVVHHLFGTGGGILRALYGDDGVDPTVGTTEATFSRANDFTVRREAQTVVERMGLGLIGAGRLARELTGAVAASSRRVRRQRQEPRQRQERQERQESQQRQDGDASVPPVRPPRGRDATRRPPSNLRVAAIAALPAEAWDGAASARGGSANTLLAAVTANLLRRARLARGGRPERNLRLLLPVDLTDREIARARPRSSGPAATMTTAEVVLEGGAPAYGDLRPLRARMKAAFIADSGNAPAVRGAGEVMRLLPEALTFRAAARAALRFDGCTSNVGAVPPGMLRLGPHVADDAAMLGFPIGNEAIAALIRYGDQVAVAVVTDPLGLGPAADLREWLREELAEWGLDEVVW